MNDIRLIGRLTKDPETRYTASGTAMATFTLAVHRDKDTADFPRLTAWGKTAEIVEQYCRKGSQIAIQGRIQTGSYEKDGKKIFTTDLIAERIELLGGKPAGESPKDTFEAINEQVPF